MKRDIIFTELKAGEMLVNKRVCTKYHINIPRELQGCVHSLLFPMHGWDFQG